MIQLYGVAGACSLSPHIVLHELDLPFELKLLKWGDKEAFEELGRINPMRQVPTLVTEEGYPLAEGQAILQYLVSKKPNTLFPQEPKAQFKALEWLSFIATALHKGFVPLFNQRVYTNDPSHFETIKTVAQKRLHRLLQITESKISEGSYVLGNDFTLVDPYLFVVLNWSEPLKVDLSPYPKLMAFKKRVAQRPSVVAAMRREGLIE